MAPLNYNIHGICTCTDCIRLYRYILYILGYYITVEERFAHDCTVFTVHRIISRVNAYAAQQ